MITTTNTAYEYHVQSRNSSAYKYMRNEHLVHYRDDIKAITAEKNVSLSTEHIKLPHAAPLQDVSLHRALMNRASNREFGESISLGELASVLYYANGTKEVRNQFGDSRYNRFAPSSGGMNSVEAFAIVLNVRGLANGIYYYNHRQHTLQAVRLGEFHDWLSEEVFYQTEWSRAGACVVLTSSFGKLAKKYGLRAYRLSLLDTGLVAQNIYLTASALDLKACASAGFIDDELNEALQVDGYETAAFLTVMVGK